MVKNLSITIMDVRAANLLNGKHKEKVQRLWLCQPVHYKSLMVMEKVRS